MLTDVSGKDVAPVTPASLAIGDCLDARPRHKHTLPNRDSIRSKQERALDNIIEATQETAESNPLLACEYRLAKTLRHMFGQMWRENP